MIGDPKDLSPSEVGGLRFERETKAKHNGRGQRCYSFGVIEQHAPKLSAPGCASMMEGREKTYVCKPNAYGSPSSARKVENAASYWTVAHNISKPWVHLGAMRHYGMLWALCVKGPSLQSAP